MEERGSRGMGAACKCTDERQFEYVEGVSKHVGGEDHAAAGAKCDQGDCIGGGSKSADGARVGAKVNDADACIVGIGS